LSSGQEPQNPLLLLGQYSDDEGDDGSSKRLNDANLQSPVLNEEVFYDLLDMCLSFIFVAFLAVLKLIFLDFNILLD